MDLDYLLFRVFLKTENIQQIKNKFIKIAYVFYNVITLFIFGIKNQKSLFFKQ